MFPEIPPWYELHSLIIHFPIALLVLATGFLVAALIRPEKRFQVTALLLIVLGTAGIFLAIETGEAAEDTVIQNDAQHDVLHEHEELAEKTRPVFAALALVLGAFLWYSRKRSQGRFARGPAALYLILYVAGLLLLLNAAQHGGELVHKSGPHKHYGITPSS